MLNIFLLMRNCLIRYTVDKTISVFFLHLEISINMYSTVLRLHINCKMFLLEKVTACTQRNSTIHWSRSNIWQTSLRTVSNNVRDCATMKQSLPPTRFGENNLCRKINITLIIWKRSYVNANMAQGMWVHYTERFLKLICMVYFYKWILITF